MMALQTHAAAVVLCSLSAAEQAVVYNSGDTFAVLFFYLKVSLVSCAAASYVDTPTLREAIR